GQGQELVYSGPVGLTGWKNLGAPAAWWDELGVPATNQPGASLFESVTMPAQAAIELELSWKERPDFLVAFGASEDPAAARRAFCLEVWDRELVVWRETELEADAAVVQQLERGAGRVR